jgi:ATP-dependent DNA helicase RecG
VTTKSYKWDYIVDFMDTGEFEILLNSAKEGNHLEFKEAKKQFSFDSGRKSLCGYYCALANEKGGRLILGVTDEIPRKVTGTNAFGDIAKYKQKIYNKFHRPIEIEEFYHMNKRVLIITVPSRPIGECIEFDGRYLKRSDDNLVEIDPVSLKKINQESIQDFSAEICVGASFEDLNKENIQNLRILLKESKKVDKKIQNYGDLQLLIDLGLIRENKITNAALILLGFPNTLKKFFPHAEIRYQYKEEMSQTRGSVTKIFQGGYLGYYEELWKTINSWNKEKTIQVGLRILKKPTFEEETIREAINNSIIHRDYSEMGSIIITQSLREIDIESPGGLLPGITIQNMVEETKVRNKLLAEVLSKCDFVESFGNGIDLMIQNQLSAGKNVPDYNKTTKYKVYLSIDGQIYDSNFAQYVSRIALEEKKELNYRELIVLTKIKEEKKISPGQITENLLNLNLIERVGTKKYILSKKYYIDTGQKGVYTRKKGLDKSRNKELILAHLKNHKRGYMEEFLDIFSGDIPKSTINGWLAELKKEEIICFEGNPQVVKGKNRGFWRLKK